MKTIGKIEAMAGIISIIAESNYMINERKHVCVNLSPEPAWKRKKCKTCYKCGDACLPFLYKGRTLFKHSKPTSNACKYYCHVRKTNL